MESKILYTDYKNNQIGVAIAEYNGENYLVTPSSNTIMWIIEPTAPFRFSPWYEYKHKNPTFEMLVEKTLKEKVDSRTEHQL